ncbi:MAG TPA: hypothetical protein VGF84_06360 [Micromonosporaceae bacterium]|jgi:hypothetical protein
MRKFPALIIALAAGVIALVVAAPSAIAAHRPPGAGAAQPMAEPSGPVDLDPLSAMTTALRTTGHNVTMTTQGSTMVGAVDPAHGAADADAKGFGLDLDEVVVNGQIYVKVDLGASTDQQDGIMPNVWMRLDPKQINAANELLVQPNASGPVDIAGIAAGITELRRDDARHLEGTIDLTKISGHTTPDPDEVTRAGTAATRVPFAVTADANGRITRFQVYAGTFDPGLSLRVDYSGYGSPHAIAAPASSVPAPPSIYALFND